MFAHHGTLRLMDPHRRRGHLGIGFEEGKRPVTDAWGWEGIHEDWYRQRPMSLFLRDYLTVVWFGIAAVLLAGLLLGVAAAIRPSRPSYDKSLAYESGVDPVGMGWSQSQIRYYVFALLFVIFDVEAVFIFPWAANIERYGVFGLVVMVAFIVLLLDGLVYAWKRGLLRWV
jgi:NADH-quinone oxidoreductase subunit A